MSEINAVETNDQEKLPNYEPLFNKEGKSNKKELHFIRKLLKKDIKKIIISTLLYIIKALPVWVCPLLISDIIDVAQARPENYLTRIIIEGVIFFVIVVQNVFSHAAYSKIVDTFIREDNAGIKITLVRKLQHLSITYFKEMENGALESKFLRDIDNVDNYYRNIIKVLIPDIISLFVAIGISLYKNPLITLFFAVVIPVNVVAVKLFKRGISSKYKNLRKDSEDLSTRLTSMVDMLTLSKSHGLETAEWVALDKRIKKVTNRGLIVDRFIAFFGSINWVISMILSGLTLFFSLFLYFKGMCTIGDVILFQSLFTSINSNVLALVNLFPTFASGNDSVDSLAEIINNEELENYGGGKVLNRYKGEVEFDHVYYHYPNVEKNVLNDISFTINPGESVAIVGNSGGGKTTIMNLVLGLLDPTSGTVKIDGNNLKDLSKVEYRHHISVVPQASILFNGSLKDNITYGNKNYTKEEIEEAVKAANIEEFLPTLPNGLDSNVGERGDKLSGGQKQRLSIARALIRKPSILILDEATSALDNISEAQVEKAIANATNFCTTFIVAHRLSTIRNVNKVIVLENGQIVQMGTYEELAKAPGRFQELLKLAR